MIYSDYAPSEHEAAFVRRAFALRREEGSPVTVEA
jgi:hypothetical protein